MTILRPLLLAAIALATLMLVATPAAAVPTALLDLSSTATSPHFVVEAGSESQARETVQYAEEGWQELSTRFTSTPPGPIHIAVIGDREYELIQPAPMTRGFATFGGDRIFLRGSQLDREVVVHELVHIFLGYTVRPGTAVPDWFNEGLAQYASGASPSTLVLIYEASAGHLLPLPELGRVDALKDDNRQMATLEGLAVVEFLVQEFGEDRLWDLVDNLSVSRTFDQALLAAYGQSGAEIDSRWAAYAEDTYSLLSPAALRILLGTFFGALALIAAAVWFIRRAVLLHGDGGPHLSTEEIEAARRAEASSPEPFDPVPPDGPTYGDFPTDSGDLHRGSRPPETGPGEIHGGGQEADGRGPRGRV